MNVYNANNVKVTVGGAELKGCTGFEFSRDIIEINQSESKEWKQFGVRGTATLSLSRKNWSKLKTFISNRLPRGFRAFK